jgi:N-methylhydantoinase B/oxoprolinase/acetone carboxylase alpha subunit
LVKDNISLKSGCLKLFNLIFSEGRLSIKSQLLARVVTENVETSQLIVDALSGTLKVIVAS